MDSIKPQCTDLSETCGRLRRVAYGVSIALAAALACHPAAAQVHEDFSGHAEPRTNDSAPAPRFVVDSNRPRWPNGVINYYYNPAGQPEGLTTEDMVALLQAAGRKWADVCNVQFNYLGTTISAPDIDATFATTDRRNVVGWELLTGNRSSFDGYTSWWYQSAGPTLVDADMVINTASGNRLAANPSGLGALLTHEMGHMLAINHSDKTQSVMYANPYHTYAFQNTLRGDDAAACASLYGASALANADRIFNWVEQTFPLLLAPTGVNSADVSGYHYRFYPGSQSYIAVIDGTLLFLPVGGAVVPVGTVEQFIGAAAAAGF